MFDYIYDYICDYICDYVYDYIYDYMYDYINDFIYDYIYINLLHVIINGVLQQFTNGQVPPHMTQELWGEYNV